MAGGFMIGSVGLASAGALPGPAQDVAHSALGVLGVHVPPGKDRYNGPECGDVANHGEYVDAHPDDPAAGKSPCGKPNRAVKHPQRSGTDPAGVPGDAGRKGPPPWAGQGKEKDKKQGDGDSSTTDLPSETPANPEQNTTTTTVAAEPSTTTVAAEPTATTSVTGEGATSTTIESTTSTTTTTAS